MGNFYTNVTLKGPSQAQITEAMVGRPTFISPTINGSTVVFDQRCEDQNFADLKFLAVELSHHFRCPALAALVHDDDFLWLQFAQNGSLRGGEYNSSPDYFGGGEAPPSGGDAAIIASAFGAKEPADVERILRSGNEAYPFAHERHAALLRVLGLPELAAGRGYRYLARGFFPRGVVESEFTRTGGGH